MAWLLARQWRSNFGFIGTKNPNKPSNQCCSTAVAAKAECRNIDQKDMKTIQIQYYQSPCGELILGSVEEKLCMCDWVAKGRREVIDSRLQQRLCATYEESLSPVVAKTITQLDEYFDGERTTFDIPLLFAGTAFRQRVWEELVRIPYGVTISYAALAQRIDHPTAVRAVANANGANPISILVPCHRVIGSDHSLTGYGGGLDKKEFLLRLERAL